MMHELDSIPIKQLSSRQLKKIYQANERFTPVGGKYADTPLMAAIKVELEDREFTKKLRGEEFNPALKWGLIISGIVISLLLVLNLFNPTIKTQTETISVETKQ